jgi:hypothetical protein
MPDNSGLRNWNEDGGGRKAPVFAPPRAGWAVWLLSFLCVMVAGFLLSAPVTIYQDGILLAVPADPGVPVSRRGPDAPEPILLLPAASTGIVEAGRPVFVREGHGRVRVGVIRRISPIPVPRDSVPIRFGVWVPRDGARIAASVTLDAGNSSPRPPGGSTGGWSAEVPVRQRLGRFLFNGVLN